MSFYLPPTIALKASQSHPENNYLNYCNNSESEKLGLLRFNGANVFSALAKFEVVEAKIGTGVHIRCFHNKKFLRVRSERDGNISPEADEPEEDQSKWTCTLFEPQVEKYGKPNKIRLFHVHKKQYTRTWLTGEEKHPGVHGVDPINGDYKYDMYDVIDLESLVILPKHVAFKGINNRYLKHDRWNLLWFTSTDKGTAESWFEVCTDGDGRVKIKVFNSLKNNYLRLHSGSFFTINADGDGSRTDTDAPPSEFWPVRIDDTTVALKCLSNGKFCTRGLNAYQNFMQANNTSTSISKDSRFRLEELVLSRRIYNTDFDLRNAIIYGETPVTMATAIASNNTSVPNTVLFRFTYKDSQSSTWGSSYSWMVGASVTASFKIPLIGTGAKLTVSGSYTRSYKWAETVTSENTVETTYTVTVPAHTSISVNLMATEGNCDVPYSYYQRDVLYNGKTVIYKKDDGLYKGVNSYNFRYEVTTLKEPDSASKPDSPPHSDSKADLPTPEKWFPIPSMFPCKKEVIPLPMPYGSTQMRIPVTSVTNTLEQQLSRDNASISPMKAEALAN